MASRWADGLPIVQVPRAVAPKPITMVLPYYQNAEFFAYQCALWEASCPEVLRPLVTVLVIDDGSPTPAVKPKEPAIALRLFRIQQDVPWNWLAARNIGAYHAAEGWILFTDMDHVVPPATFQSLIDDVHDPRVIYAFSRREFFGPVIPPHSASFFMTRRMFWRIGGYDETLSGHYGTDGDFRRRMAAVAPIQVLPHLLLRFENVKDSSTSRYARKLPADQEAVKALVKARGPQWRPKTLTFPYQEVTC